MGCSGRCGHVSIQMCSACRAPGESSRFEFFSIYLILRSVWGFQCAVARHTQCNTNTGTSTKQSLCGEGTEGRLGGTESQCVRLTLLYPQCESRCRSRVPFTRICLTLCPYGLPFRHCSMRQYAPSATCQCQLIANAHRLRQHCILQLHHRLRHWQTLLPLPHPRHHPLPQRKPLCLPSRLPIALPTATPLCVWNHIRLLAPPRFSQLHRQRHHLDRLTPLLFLFKMVILLPLNPLR
jgi:hypothetical protein